MTTFIEEVIREIRSKHSDLRDVVIILPSRRASVFVKEACKQQISVGFLPEIFSIEDFVTRVSGIDKLDQIELLFHFYDVYRTLESDPQNFDVFTNWATTAIQDFSEIDQYLVNAEDVLANVRDIKRLQKWSMDGNIQPTEMMSDYYSFVEKLGTYYKALSKSLYALQKGYQGLIFKEAVHKIDYYLSKRKNNVFYFLGFNALTTSEEVLIQKALQLAKADIYWDIDEAFLNTQHQAGYFIRKYKNEWPYFEKNSLHYVSNYFGNPKNIQVIGATKNVTQMKEAGYLLSGFSDFKKTALVLGDESLLPVVLNSIPDNVPSINITMGYPLKDMPTYQMIKNYFELYLMREKMGIQENKFYYKSVLQFLNSSFLRGLISDTELERVDELQMKINKDNMTFLTVEFLNSELKNSSLKGFFQKSITIESFINNLIEFIEEIKDSVQDMDKEYLFRFYTSFLQLKNLTENKPYFNDLKVLYNFFKRIIANEVLSFQGEPLSGLQCMGVLESRVLDFDHVIITSLNEGVIPRNSQQPSFIPFDVKSHFGLPTYKEKDAIFSYHFFRLLQRAKNIYLLYNTENDDYGSGERSRFISQLELLRNDIKFSTVSPTVNKNARGLVEIPKTDLVIKSLKERAAKGFSPSAIGSYLYDPIDFYKQKVLGLSEKEEVEETIAANTMGSIIHKVLEQLYKPNLNEYLTVDHFVTMEQRIKNLVDEQFPKFFYEGNISTGKNKLIYEIILNYLYRFIRKERNLVKEGSRLKVLAVEKQLEMELNLSDFEFPIKIYGEIDRIDELDGITRIIDYKTGVVESNHMKIPETWELNDYKHSKAIQVMVYAMMYLNHHPEKEHVKAGNFSFKRLSNGFQTVTIISGKNKSNLINRTVIEKFKESLGQIFVEIFDINTPFVEKVKETKK